MMEQYISKKFAVIVLILLATVALALLGKMSGFVATVFTAIVTVYPPAQAYVDGKKQ